MPGKGTSWAKPIITADHLKVFFREGVGMSGALILRDVIRRAAAPTPPVAPLPGGRRKRGRPDELTPPKNRKIRELYDRWRVTEWSLQTYAEDHLGVSRQNLSNWLRELTHPDARSREQIKARTEIDVGPRPPRGRR